MLKNDFQKILLHAVRALVAHTVREEILDRSRPERPRGKNAKDMKKLVSKTLAISPMTAARRKRLKALAAQPDAAIDLTEIPELPESFWKNAVPNPFYRPVKQQLTVRLDADVVAWLKQQGKGYQTRLNQVLRAAMVGSKRA